MLEYIREAKLL